MACNHLAYSSLETAIRSRFPHIQFSTSRAYLVDASKMLHRVDNDGSNSKVEFFDQVQRLGIAFRQKDVVVAIEEIDTRNMTMIC
jgi:hypothetical protein